MNTKGLPLVTVSTTQQRLSLPLEHGPLTIINGTGPIYYRYDPTKVVVATTGSETVLRADGFGKLDANGAVVVGSDVPYLDLVVATAGASSTVRIEPGALVLSDGQADLNAANGVMTHVTHGRTVVSGAAGVTTLTAGGGVACKYWRLKLSTGSAAIYYHPDGTDATDGGGADAGHEELDATTGFILIKKTAATILKVWVTVSGATINWEAGN